MSLEDGLFEQRVARIHEIEALGYSPFGKRFDFTYTVPEILRDYSAKTAEELTPEVRIKVAGRVQTKRPMGKAGFLHIQQNGGKLQLYIRKDGVPERDYALFTLLDLGDILGAEGYLLPHPHRRTQPARKSSNSSRKRCSPCPKNSPRPRRRGNALPPPLPRSHHANPEVRNVFVTRAKIISSIRALPCLGKPAAFIEVETPMLQAIYGGSRRAPFRHASQHARYRSLPAHRFLNFI